MTWAERVLVVWAMLLLPFVAVSLRLAGFQKTYHRLETSRSARASASAEQVGKAVDVAARNIPLYRPTCLPRSLVLWHMLRRHGTPAELLIGVRQADGDFVAHAWVEHGGKVINDAPDIAERYARMDAPAFRLNPHRKFL